jgi:hypothetical protein
MFDVIVCVAKIVQFDRRAKQKWRFLLLFGRIALSLQQFMEKGL